MTELVKIASDGLAFLTKMNPNHDERGRFSGGPGQESANTRFTGTSRVGDDRFSHVVTAAGLRYSPSAAHKHDKGLTEAAAAFSKLHDNLRAAAVMANVGEVNANRVSVIGEKLGENVTAIKGGIAAANTVRQKNGDDAVEMHDRDREALDHASALADHIEDSPGAVKAAWDVGARYSR